MNRRGTALTVFPAKRLLYIPELEIRTYSPPDQLRQGSVLEYQHGNLEAAAESYRAHTDASDLKLRAESLLSLGRVLRKVGRRDEAIDVYRDLLRCGEISISGIPAELLAIEARATLMSETGDSSQDLQKDISDLFSGLCGSRWHISQGIFGFYMQRASALVKAVGIEDIPYPSDLEQRQRLSQVAIQIVEENARSEWGENRSAQEIQFVGEEIPYQVVNNHLTSRSEVAFILGPETLNQRLLTDIRDAFEGSGYQASLTTPDGRTISGPLPEGGKPSIIRTSSVTGLPWNLYLEATPSRDGTGLWSPQRHMFLAGLGLLLLLILASIYMLTVSVLRQIQMARLESQFVSAVSHEFRSPLTSIRQIGEMLASGRVRTPEQTQEYYGMLQRDTAHLQRLVENFLDFGRTQAGARRYNFHPLDPGGLIRKVVTDFRDELNDPDCDITVDIQGGHMRINADQEAIERAVWNLLDNAVRYSPDQKHVRVKTSVEGKQLQISISDEGLGIEPDEKSAVFQRFVRGRAAESTGSRGTGIGLALVKQLIEAHGGSIEVNSEPGKGSEFTIRLPVEVAP